MMAYIYNISVRGKNFRVIQVQMWKDGKIWREMSNAIENQNNQLNINFSTFLLVTIINKAA